ncbi:MAG: amidohydrolase family protein [Luteitalea sp.]|nr:amidohydrolase family protein [Luteitalea sp.]
MPVNDSHCHFFSPRFFDALATLKGWEEPERGHRVTEAASWEHPDGVDLLADRWVAALDANGVGRAMLIASVPHDESSVAAALARHPTRFVGACMVNPLVRGAEMTVASAFAKGLRMVCLFPAMHKYTLTDQSVECLADILAGRPGSCLFVHCGVLTLGIRKRLGLPTVFEARYGNPLELQGLAARHPTLPIIVPHFGAGFLRELLMVADVCPNVHVDTSSSNSWTKYWPGLTLSNVFRQALLVMGPRRILFGTDSSWFPRGWHRAVYDAQVAALDELGVGEQDRELIFAGNFDRLFQAGEVADPAATVTETSLLRRS